MKTNEVTNKPKEIKAEISFEIIGEDKPTKYAKRRERWRVAAVYSLIVWLITLVCAFFVGLNIPLLIISGISFAVFFVSLCNSGNTYPEEGYGSFPYEGGF